jgi:competence protein ComEA
MSSKRSNIKEYFTFSRGERNGVIILIILIFILLFSPMIYRSFFTSMPSNNSDFYVQVDSFFSSVTMKPDDVAKTITNPIEKEEIEIKRVDKLFYFDPNSITLDELVLLGLSVKQANVIEKFRNKGGKFYTAEDLAKVYVIDSAKFKKLKPWIKIDKLALDRHSRLPKDSSIKVEKKPIIVDLNRADTTELTKIKGIGRVFARRIVAYRDLLGGFVSITQLSEVYGIKPELVSSMLSQVIIDSTRIKPINLNLISYEDLRKHPYLTEFQAKAIIYYRSKVGNIKNKNELLVNKILTPERYKSINRYLTTN